MRTIEYQTPAPPTVDRRLEAFVSLLGVLTLTLGGLTGLYIYALCLFAAMDWEAFWKQHNAESFLVPLGVSIALMIAAWLCRRFEESG